MAAILKLISSMNIQYFIYDSWNLNVSEYQWTNYNWWHSLKTIIIDCKIIKICFNKRNRWLKKITKLDISVFDLDIDLEFWTMMVKIDFIWLFTQYLATVGSNITVFWKLDAVMRIQIEHPGWNLKFFLLDLDIQ